MMNEKKGVGLIVSEKSEEESARLRAFVSENDAEKFVIGERGSGSAHGKSGVENHKQEENLDKSDEREKGEGKETDRLEKEREEEKENAHHNIDFDHETASTSQQENPLREMKKTPEKDSDHSDSSQGLNESRLSGQPNQVENMDSEEQRRERRWGVRGERVEVDKKEKRRGLILGAEKRNEKVESLDLVDIQFEQVSTEVTAKADGRKKVGRNDDEEGKGEDKVAKKGLLLSISGVEKKKDKKVDIDGDEGEEDKKVLKKQKVTGF